MITKIDWNKQSMFCFKITNQFQLDHNNIQVHNINKYLSCIWFSLYITLLSLYEKCTLKNYIIIMSNDILIIVYL